MDLAPSTTVAILAKRFLGLDFGLTWAATAETIVIDLRLPRVLTAMVVGMGLAVAGATFQGLLRNPLADPYVLGTASGAALGAAIAVLMPVRTRFLRFGLAQHARLRGCARCPSPSSTSCRATSSLSPSTSLLLTGYAVGSLLSAGLALAMYLSGTGLRQIFSFLLGGFDGDVLGPAGGGGAADHRGTIAILLRARSLNGLLLGRRRPPTWAWTSRERVILIALASLVTAAGVAIAGLIGFVGLVVPHFVRMLVGPNARLVLPISALFGASLLAAADLVARMLGGVPVGVVTAIIGAPFFLVLLRRARTGYEL